MSLTATGTVKAAPDEGYITIGVRTFGAKSSDAVAENTKLMKALYASLKAKGVKPEGIHTTEFSVAENYKTVYEKDDEGKKYPKQVKDGFVVSNTVNVTVCELEKFGEVLDAVTAGGANQVHGISFGSSKSKEKLEEARVQALKEVNAKAKTLASGLGVKVGKVMNIQEGSVYRPKAVYETTRAMAAAPAGDVPVSGGSLTFAVSVTVTWQLAQDHKNCGCGDGCGCSKKAEKNSSERRKHTHPPARKLGDEKPSEPKDN